MLHTLDGKDSWSEDQLIMAKLESFNESLLELGKTYSRKTLAQEQELESIERSQSGVIQFENCILLLINLGESKYHNRFDAHKFRMFFQDLSTKNTPVVQRIANCEPTYLFVGAKEISNSGPKEYTYIGKAIPVEMFGEKPVEITWVLCHYQEMKNKPWFRDIVTQTL